MPEILLKVALSTINPNLNQTHIYTDDKAVVQQRLWYYIYHSSLIIRPRQLLLIWGNFIQSINIPLTTYVDDRLISRQTVGVRLLEKVPSYHRENSPWHLSIHYHTAHHTFLLSFRMFLLHYWDRFHGHLVSMYIHSLAVN
jgi:hypothetical protein